MTAPFPCCDCALSVLSALGPPPEGAFCAFCALCASAQSVQVASPRLAQSFDKGPIARVARPPLSQPATQSGRADPSGTGGPLQRQATTDRIDKGQRDPQGQPGWSPPFASASFHRGAPVAARTIAKTAALIGAGSRSQAAITLASSGSVLRLSEGK